MEQGRKENTPMKLQDKFLNEVRKNNISITLRLLSGKPIKGLVKGFDNFTIILESEGKQMTIYKHTVSTIAPEREINFTDKVTTK